MESTNNSKLDRALHLLITALAQGTEWPDAHSRACTKVGLTVAQGEALTALFDDVTAEHNG